jgi:dienelactone hydrolase
MRRSHSIAVFCTALAGAIMLLAAPAGAQLHAQTVDYKQGDTELQGYLAYDGAIRGKRPAVLLIHARDGMSDETRRNTEMIAKLGYVVFAADIFGKTIRPKEVKEMQVQSALYNKDRPLMRARAQAGLSTLQQMELVDASKIAVIGYCFGGTVAIELISTGAPVVGTVAVHGSFRNFTPGWGKNVNGRVIILHGDKDVVAPWSEVDLVLKELRQAEVDWQMELYAGADHNFTALKGIANERATARAWAATQKFFTEVLRDGATLTGSAQSPAR